MAGDEQIKIAHRLAAAPERSCRCELIGTLESPNVVRQLLGSNVGLIETETKPGLLDSLERLENLLLRLSAHTRQGAQAFGPCLVFQIRERFNPQFFVEKTDFLGPYALKLKQFEKGARHLLELVFEILQFAGLHDLHNLRGEVRADAGNVGE